MANIQLRGHPFECILSTQFTQCGLSEYQKPPIVGGLYSTCRHDIARKSDSKKMSNPYVETKFIKNESDYNLNVKSDKTTFLSLNDDVKN